MLAKMTTHRQRYWLKHVKAADLSDTTIAEYAAVHDVSLKGLYQWKTKLLKLKLFSPAASAPAPDFVPVKSSPVQPPLQVDHPIHTPYPLHLRHLFQFSFGLERQQGFNILNTSGLGQFGKHVL